MRPDNWKENFKFIILTDLISFLSLLPYAYLLSKRAPDIDDIQLLVYTHAPDFFRYPLIICAIALIFLALAIYLDYAKIKQTSTIFFLAFSSIPLIVFNQQVITGRSLQPFHYEFYVVNYIAGLVIVLSVFLFLKNLQKKQMYPVILINMPKYT